MANVATATRSAPGFEAMNARAAAIAFASGPPFIDCERSIASTTDFACPRFWAPASETPWPFSASEGAFGVRSDVTTLTRIWGYELGVDSLHRDGGLRGRCKERDHPDEGEVWGCPSDHENPPKLAEESVDR